MIDSELRGFLEDGLGIHIGTRSAEFQPSGARASAIRIEDDAVHVVVFVPEVAAPRVLPDLRSNGHAAVVLARPTDDRACQVKGVFVDAWPAAAEDRGTVVLQWERFLDKLARIGIPRQVATGWIPWPAVAVRLRATAVFEQTPGPGAGAPLGPRP